MSLFCSVESALRFAFNPDRVACDRPGVARLMGSHGDGPGDLSGLDGAAQAGVIRRKIATLPHLQQSLLVARFAPALIPCGCGQPCCAKWRPNLEWQGAVRIIADHAKSEPLSGCKAEQGVVLSILAKHFGYRVESVVATAAEKGLSSGTASNHTGKIRRWLYGAEVKSPEHGGKERIPGAEDLALLAAQRLLSDLVEAENAG